RRCPVSATIRSTPLSATCWRPTSAISDAARVCYAEPAPFHLIPPAIGETIMPFRTAVTELLGVRHPILLAPMGAVAGGRLAAAVTAAGGFGMIGPGYLDEAWVEREFDAAGNARIGIGFITWDLARNPKRLTAALE